MSLQWGLGSDAEEIWPDGRVWALAEELLQWGLGSDAEEIPMATSVIASFTTLQWGLGSDAEEIVEIADTYKKAGGASMGPRQ